MTKHNLKHFKALSLCMLIAFSSCKENDKKEDTVTESTNILLQEWTGPYGGVPAFDKMNVAEIGRAHV